MKELPAVSGLLVACLLAGCSSGGSSPAPSPTPPPAPSGLSYPTPPAFTVNTAITALTPTVTGNVTSYAVSPALPAGLALNAGSGAISGTPTVISAAANYVVTASNSTGSTAATIPITVRDVPPVVSYGATTFNFNAGWPVNLVPTSSGGAVVIWAIGTAVPAGLTFNTTTGVISGTPAAETPPGTYAITATNSGGNASVELTLEVNAAPPAPQVSYSGVTYSFTTGVPVDLSPVSIGGQVQTWSVNPALPAGLTLRNDGHIIGTPTQVAATANYVVTAQNPNGTDTVNLTITVAAPGPDTGVLLKLGHTHGEFPISHDGSRIMSGDPESIVLWNAQSGAMIASTSIDIGCIYGSQCFYQDPVRWALHGPTAVIRRLEGFEVWSSADGSVLASIAWPQTSDSWWHLASDGSYIAGGNATGLTVWSPTGTVLFTRSGNHGTVKAFAAAGDLRMALGPAGNNVIEHLALPAGTSTTTPAFSGTFHSWFMDGGSFFSNAGNTAWVYSQAAVQRDLVALPSLTKLAGQGDWLWIQDSGTPALHVYRVGASTTPSASFALFGSSIVVPSTGTIFISNFEVNFANRIEVVDLSGATLIKRNHTSPIPYMNGFGAASASDWAFTTNHGLMLGEVGGPPPTMYSLGEARSIAGSNSRIAVATMSGTIFYFDTNTRQLQGQIAFVSGKVQLSADGNRLAASAENVYSQYLTDRTLRIFSLPSQAVLAEWPHTFPNDQLLDFTFARSGDVVGRVTKVINVNTTNLASPLNAAPFWTVVGAPTTFEPPPIQISPNGTLIALADGRRTEQTATNIYLNGALSSAASGYVVGWVDDNRLLVNRYITEFGVPVHTGTDLVSASGQMIAASLPLPQLSEIQGISANRIYSPERNEVFDVTTGERTWSSQAPHVGSAGAVAGPNIVFTSNATVRIEPL